MTQQIIATGGYRSGMPSAVAMVRCAAAILEVKDSPQVPAIAQKDVSLMVGHEPENKRRADAPERLRDDGVPHGLYAAEPLRGRSLPPAPANRD